MTRFGYPVTLDLTGVAVLVVGAGPIAARKVAGLVAAGAVVRVVAPDVADELDRATVAELRRRPYEPADLDGVRLVVTATGDAAVDARVAADATAAGIWVNAADQPADCTFILPAIARHGPVSIAVSTDGASPALARRLPRSGRRAADRGGRRARRRPRGPARRGARGRWIDGGRRLVGAHRRRRPADPSPLSGPGYIRCQSQFATFGRSREDQGRHPLGDQQALERRGDRARSAQAGRGAGQAGRLRTVPLRRAPRHR